MKAAATLATALTCWLSTALSAAEPARPDAKAIEFFESRVRPVLVEHCLSCHGPKKQQASLRLDSRAAVLQGSDSGPVIVPGKPEESSLVRVVRRTGKVKMPPKSELSPEAIADLSAWVKMGAPWPDNGPGPGKTETVAEVRKRHWSFQPVRNPAPPEVKTSDWAKTPVDRFILARLEAKGFRPAPPADRRTLLRRVTYDLTGLPPTPEEFAAFEADSSPDAFAKVVDRLLASPQYGERWGRHWLDVARYADTKGYVFQEERRFPFSYTYRDWVINALNDDLPYDRFILEQLAADQLALGDNKRPLAAMGYLTLGRRFLNIVHDIIDDRIDVTMRGMQGLTVTCARCHDHKFDPIPTKDYYSLYGVFANSIEPKDLPLIAEPERTEAYIAYEKEVKAREDKVRAFIDGKSAELLTRFRAHAADYMLAVRGSKRLPGEEAYQALTPGELNQRMVRRWQEFLERSGKNHHPILAPWHAFAASPQKEFAAKAPALAEKFAANADPKARLNPLVAKAFAGKAPESLRDVAVRYAELFAAADKLWKEESSRGAAKLADADQEAIRQLLYGPGPLQLRAEEVMQFFDRAMSDERIALQRKVDEFRATSPVAPPRAMVLNDATQMREPHVLVRGNPNTPGAQVPRQFLLILAGEQRKPFTQGSGRLELARAIASKDNPLTARVMVNRIWLHHFGQGLVRTPSDFGLRGEAPTHPELLDYLAWSFMENGWSVKKLHRLIVLSSVYQQSSGADPRLTAADPDNRLLGRMNRRRLDFEAMRDSLLFAAGRLDPARGGPGVELTKAPFTRRRSVYGFIDRQNLPGLYRTFDLASPDTSSPQRFTTTVPQQALFLMNSPFVVEQARHLAARVTGQTDPEKRIAELHRLCYGRPPDADEMKLGLKFVELAGKEVPNPAPPALSAWEKYAQVLLLSNEFVFLD